MKKKLVTTVCSLAVLAAALGTANAQYVSQGYVFCDANTNNVIDSGDVPLPNIQVVITNSAGTFSNAVTTTAAGAFTVNLPVGTATYRTYLGAGSLPLGATVSPTQFDFTLSSSMPGVVNFFLVRATNCSNLVGGGACWLDGGGAIKDGRGKPEFTFGIQVAPDCDGTNDSEALGNLNIVAHSLKLHLKGHVLQVDDCGTINGTNFLAFSGLAEVKGIAGNRANYGLVRIEGRVQDGPSGADSIYVRAYTDAGQTIVLISSQVNNPTTVAPRRVTNGDIRIYSGSCDNPPPWWDDDHDDDDDMD